MLAIAVIFLFSFVSAAFSSTSVSNPRYYSGTSMYTTAPSGFEYSSLISGINAPENEEEFYDMMITILPGGCKPIVVRSDLLEEQNVPVFCELTAVKINPGVDISKIARISVKNLENNPYIAGVGFYPARAAIRSTNTLSGSPVTNNIGYAVVVLKRTETENAMPSNISAKLSAMFEYDAVNGFGIGVNEMYLPVMSDDEFTSRQKEYGFFNGAGYLRVDSMDQNTAVISIYDSQNRRLFSQRLEKDITSREFRIPMSGFSHSYENQAVTMTLREITMPQTSAKIIVNDGSYVAYKNGKFADKCTLTNVVSSGGGTGTVTVSCGGKTVILEKKFNKINLIVNGAPGDYALGDKIPLLNNQVVQNYYLVYAGSVPNENVVGNKKTFIFLAKEKAGTIMTIEKSRQIARNIESQISKMNKGDYYNSLSKIKTSSLFSSDELILVYQGDKAKNSSGNEIEIEFKEAKFENAVLTGASGAEEYYNKANNGYDDVESKFPNEKNNYVALGDTNVSFGPLSLWSKYALASELKQEQDVLEILSEIRNTYPNSKNMIKLSKGVDKTAEQIMADSDNLLSSEGASTFIEDQNLYLELVSVNEPAESEASVELTYAGIMNSQTTTEPVVGPVKSDSGEAILKVGQSLSVTGGFYLSVKNITSDNSNKKVNISYSCPKVSNKELVLSKNSEPQLANGCDVQITIREIDYNADEKKSNVSLKIEGIKTLKVGEGIPTLFNFKVDSITKNEDNSLFANVTFNCPRKTGDKTKVIRGEEIRECGITIKEVTDINVTITYPLSSTTSTPQTSSTETTIGTDTLTARMGEKFIDVGAGKVQVTLKSFTADKAIFTYSCNNSITNKDIDIKKGSTEILPGCENSQIKVNKINLKEVAKVELNPKIKGRIREANFTFSIGIEKRSDFLLPSPDEMNKQIKELDEAINKWKNTTEKLGTLVKGMKAACLATSGALTLKNWATGLTGDAAARHEVMPMWNSICEKLTSKGDYTSVDSCLLENNDNIQKTVDSRKKAMTEYNTLESTLAKNKSNQINGTTDYSKVKAGVIQKLQATKYSGVKLLKEDGTAYTDTNVDAMIAMIESDSIDSYKLRDIYVTLQQANDSSLPKEFRDSIQTIAYRDLIPIQKANQDKKALDENAKAFGLPIDEIGTSLNDEKTKELDYNGKYLKEYKSLSTSLNLPIETTRVSLQAYKSNIYLYALSGSTDKLLINKIYKIDGSGTNNKLIFSTNTSEKSIVDANVAALTTIAGTPGTSPIVNSEMQKELGQIQNVRFKYLDPNKYKNRCKNCDGDTGVGAKFFSKEPYKGLPSVLPFDKEEGWYVKVENNIAALGAQKSYTDAGMLNAYYICNVGADGNLDTLQDECTRFDMYSGAADVQVLGIDSARSRAIITRAISAVRQASDAIAKNPSAGYITINGMKLKVQNVEGTAGGKCTDFMSPSDCNIMFNVCDPVVCPSSRCDMGGNYRVDNVIQSGIIGSIALCLPNFKEGIFIPVCLSGIHAGMEGWISIMQAHRDCLNESLATNKTIGICDEIYSVYQCDFMWKQIGPYANALAKNALSGTLFGAGSRGGGEYMFVNQAFSNAEDSWQYFTSSYASGSTLAFGGRSVSEIGSDVCKAKLSTAYPDELGAALEPDSPVQIYAFFDEMTYTDATIPPTSQYKVYYHIFAGNDQGHYYQVYLKSSTSSVGTISRGSSNIASGYVASGETIDQTRDFLDNSGFKELCVRIDTKDYCGFKSVTTDFAINYAKDKAIQDQTNNQVTTETECVSGSPSAGALITPNIQQAAESAISPEIYNQGIIRVCSSQNPSATVNPSRWTQVGYCSNTNIKCWIDGNSVKNAIQGRGIENATLQQIDAMGVDQLIAEGGMTSAGGNDSIKTIMSTYPLLNPTTGIFTPSVYSTMETNISGIYDKMVFSSQKAALLYYKSMVYDRIARSLFLNNGKTVDVPVNPSVTEAESSNTATSSNTNQQSVFTIKRVSKFLLSYDFVFKNGVQTNFYFATNDRSNLRYSRNGFDITLFDVLSNKLVEGANFNTYMPQLKLDNSGDYAIALILVGATINGDNLVLSTSAVQSTVTETTTTEKISFEDLITLGLAKTDGEEKSILVNEKWEIVSEFNEQNQELTLWQDNLKMQYSFKLENGKLDITFLQSSI